jgi:hypothetical protein
VPRQVANSSGPKFKKIRHLAHQTTEVPKIALNHEHSTKGAPVAENEPDNEADKQAAEFHANTRAKSPAHAISNCSQIKYER